MAIRVAIIEDDRDMRQAFEQAVQAEGDLDLSGSYPSSEAFLGRPEGLDGLDVVLSDLHLPGQSGIQCIAQCKPRRPNVQWLVITIFEDNANLFNALMAGATGYLLKTASPKEIAQAIRDIHAGGSPMSLAIARMVVASVQQKQVNAALVESLTAREHELVQLLAEGYRYKEIADKLQLSIETVRTYIRGIYGKLQVHSRTEAINRLYER
ncbi:MAG: response regulator transcription factor [Flavobacteriales bacterium]|jgi:DNA-binding NarL/FixJ family response regulator|nr:response regulator transcription factor [Flavobacteriales bacterium]TXI79950.1 MAG: response regulator transcription factor [Flavobacteriales bacterium]